MSESTKPAPRSTIVELPERPYKPLTMADADLMDASGHHELARIARRYAKDRPRWWHRFTGRAAS